MLRLKFTFCDCVISDSAVGQLLTKGIKRKGLSFVRIKYVPLTSEKYFTGGAI